MYGMDGARAGFVFVAKPEIRRIPMYIIYSNGKFELSENVDHAVAKIEAPIYVENGRRQKLRL